MSCSTLNRRKKRKHEGLKSGSDKDDDDDDAPLKKKKKDDDDDEDDAPLIKKKVKFRDCKKCDGCLRKEDCGDCQICKDKAKAEAAEEKEKADKNKSDDEDDTPLKKKKVEASPAADKGKTLSGTVRIRNNYFCGACDGCLRKEDCAECRFCKDKPKFGGPNKLKKKCMERVCGNKTPYTPESKAKKKVSDVRKSKKRHPSQ